MRIVFMGTPEFAVASLDMLNQAGYDIVSVVTTPDKPAGRGKKLRSSAVKLYAVENSISILQPVKLRDPIFIEQLEQLKPDIFVVVAFRMLPEVVWSIPSIGTFNLHASLLPDYRGAAPINWVLINGETRTGVTTFMIDKQIDTGNILLQREVEVPFEWNAGDLHDTLMKVGAELVLETVKGLEEQKLHPVPQDDSLFLHPAPKIFKEDCRINWERSARHIYNHIRGLSPYPVAWTMLEDKMVKLFKAQIGTVIEDEVPGHIEIASNQSFIKVATLDRWIEIEELQMEGKRRMHTHDFLQGYKEKLQLFI